MLCKTETAEWFTTPAELRKIADELEIKWANATVGDDVPAHVERGENVRLRIVIDQEKMQRWRSKEG